MSVLSTYYTQYGFSTRLTPPRSGLYYSTVAIYNPLNFTYTVQNGVNQNTLASQNAQLFAVPTTGSPPVLAPINWPYGGAAGSQYGAWFGPVSAVWFEPGETPGSYPTTLGPLNGIVQWTPNHVMLPHNNPVVIVPTGPISQVVITQALPGETITMQGWPSGFLQTSVVSASRQLTFNTEFPGSDTFYYVTDTTGDSTATISVILAGPAVSPAGGGGGGTLVNTKYTQDNYVIVGAIVLPSDPSNTIGPFYAHIGAGQSTTYTGIFASTLSGTCVGDIQQNGVTVAGLSGITITDTPTAFAPDAMIVVADHDAFLFVPTDVTGSPVGLTIEFDRTDAS